MPLTAAIRLIVRWLTLTLLPQRQANRARQPVSMPTAAPAGEPPRRRAHSPPAPSIPTPAATPSRPLTLPTLDAHRLPSPTIPPACHPSRPPHRPANSPPQSTPPRLKSFLEKTLTRATPPLPALLALLLLTACTPTPTHDLHVFAAASLREALTQTADAFHRANPNTQVVTNFAGSQVLRLQIESGARADLVISANPHHLNALQHAGLLAAPPAAIATNHLVLAVPAANPAGISGLHDLTQSNRRLVMAAESVPAGAYARQMLTLHAVATGQPGFPDAVLQRVISFETNVRQVAAKLELGEADAGFVYRTDVLAATGRLQVIQTPSQVQVTAHYSAAILRDAPNPDLAQRFLTFLSTPEAQTILARHGFAPAAASTVR